MSLESSDWSDILLKMNTTFFRNEKILLGSPQLHIQKKKKKKKKEDHSWILFFGKGYSRMKEFKERRLSLRVHGLPLTIGGLGRHL